MGCGASMPKADFLSAEQPEPSNGHLHAFPSEGLTMHTWSHFDPGTKYHQMGGVLGALTTVTVGVNEHQTDPTISAYDQGSELSDAVGNGGVGNPETLVIAAGPDQIASMTMPPHMAFGIPVVLRDAAGQVIAVVATAEKSRPSSMSKSKVQIWGTKPIPGQAATDVGGIQGYLWAYAERRAMSSTFSIFDGQGKLVAKGNPIKGNSWQYKFATPEGQGLMLATTTAGSNKQSLDIQCAKGVDAALAICMMAAMQVGHDELRVYPKLSRTDHDHHHHDHD